MREGEGAGAVPVLVGREVLELESGYSCGAGGLGAGDLDRRRHVNEGNGPIMKCLPALRAAARYSASTDSFMGFVPSDCQGQASQFIMPSTTGKSLKKCLGLEPESEKAGMKQVSIP